MNKEDSTTPTPEIAPALPDAAWPETPTPESPITAPKEKEEVVKTESEAPLTQPTIYIDTKPSVSFSQGHIMFDSDNLENNEIHDIPFAEAELRVDEDEDIDSVQISDEFLPMEADEIL